MRSVALIILLGSSHTMASETTCSKAIIDKFLQAREIFLSVDSLQKDGYRSPDAVLWKSETDKLGKKCNSASYIELPFGRAIGVSELYDLMGAYIYGKGIEEWQAKFSLAQICYENKKVCSKYLEKTSSKDLDDLLKDDES